MRVAVTREFVARGEGKAMSVESLLERVMAQNEIIIEQNERLLLLLVKRATQPFDEVTNEVLSELQKRFLPRKS
jgi:hypothetical protein